MKTILQTISVLIANGALYASPLPQNAQLLATNSVETHYLGTLELPCRHLTADCPDKCNHATMVARFRVLKNMDYQQNSEYGDEKILPGSILEVDIKNPTPGQEDEAVFSFISKLKVGDRVRLTQKHYYGTLGNTTSPYRPITHMLVDETAPSIPATPPAPKGDYSVMPL